MWRKRNAMRGQREEATGSRAERPMSALLSRMCVRSSVQCALCALRRTMSLTPEGAPRTEHSSWSAPRPSQLHVRMGRPYCVATILMAACCERRFHARFALTSAPAPGKWPIKCGGTFHRASSGATGLSRAVLHNTSKPVQPWHNTTDSTVQYCTPWQAPHLQQREESSRLMP